MSITRTGRLLALASFLLAAERSSASLITFETTPNGSTPVDNRTLINPYEIDGGGTVRFFFDTNRNNVYDAGIDAFPRFEQIGANADDGYESRYWSDIRGFTVYDRARPGFVEQLGDFFLRQPESLGKPAPFIIAYDTPQTIREFSGEIWDIDGAPQGPATEQWLVEALDASGNVLTDPVYSPLGRGGALDSLPWTFGFRDLPDGFRSVRITFIGGKTGSAVPGQGIGLAFNNFSALRSLTAIPEPSSLVLVAISCVSLALLRTRLPVASLTR